MKDKQSKPSEKSEDQHAREKHAEKEPGHRITELEDRVAKAFRNRKAA